MADIKAILRGGSTENLIKGLSGKVAETDKGICFSVKSDNPEMVTMLKTKI